MTGIYKIENLINHKVYIGKSKNIKQRFCEHIKALNDNNHCNNHLQRAWNKYSSINFSFEIIELCSEKEINEREKYWINFYGGINSKNTYNIIEGGLGGRGNNEWLEKISNTVKQHYINGDYDCRKKGKMIWIIKNGIQLKIYKTQFYNYKKDGWKRGRLSFNEETKRKIKEKTKGKLNGFYGKHHTEETKRKMRKKHKISKKTHNILSKCNSEKFKKLKWINNSSINKRVEDVNIYINNGWVLGRLPLPQISESLKKYHKNAKI